MSHRVLGVDVGTTEVKCLVVDVDAAHVVGGASAGYPSRTSPDGAHEQDPADVWAAVVRAVREALRDAPDRAIGAVGLSGHMHSLLLVGADDRPVGPLLTWADRRSGPIGRALSTDPRFRARAGNDVVDAFTAPKLAWAARERPELLARARRLVLVKDYVGFLLTGTWMTDPTDAMGTLLWDARERRWDAELFAACGARPELAVPVAPSGSLRGGVTPWAAEQTGLPVGLAVAVGAGDVSSTALGVSVRDARVVGMNVGTAAQIVGAVGDLDPGDGFVFGSALDEGYLTMASVYAAGACVDDVRRLVRDDGRLLDDATVAPGADGLTVLPYLFGTAVPVKDDAVRGGVWGLGAGHGRAHLVAAALEGVAFACADALDAVMRTAGRPEVLHVTGGVTRSARWRAALAGVVDVPVVRVARGGSPMGAAMLGALAGGLVTDVAQLAPALEPAPVEPVPPDDAARYADARRRFRDARDRLLAPADGSPAGWPPPATA